MYEETGVRERPFEILLVEDNPADVLLAKEAIKESTVPCSLHVLRDGEEAMSYLMRKERYSYAERPDIILLDLNLPRKTGLEVLKEIKESRDLKHIPVIVLTTSDAAQDIERAYAGHANCYIIKPIDFEKFSKIVQSILDYWFSVATLKVSY
jgi:chemotaxis family two-component system response regulator Rcp1